MADVFSHVLFAFVLFTILGWGVAWIDRKWVAVGMVGSIFPDLNRVDLIVDAYTVSTLLGIPFDWGAIHTLGGVLVLAAVGAVLFDSSTERRRAFLLLVGGGVSHLFFDVLKMWADGWGGAYLYPFTWVRFPTPGWYVSSDPGVAILAILVAATVYLLDRKVVAAAFSPEIE